MLISAWRIARHCPESIWTPAFWFLMNSAVFYGFGPLVEVYGNAETRAVLGSSVLAVTPVELARTSLLSTSGIICLMTGFWLHIRTNSGQWKKLTNIVYQPAPAISPTFVALAFVAFGAVLRYAFIKPAHWGMTGMVVPGVLTSVAPILDVGFGIMAYLAARGSLSMKIMLGVGLPLHLFMTLLSMSKMELVIAMMFPAIGAYMGNRKPFNFVMSLLIIACVFVPAQSLVHYGRAAILEKSGSINQAGYLERLKIVTDFISKPNEPIDIAANDDLRQGWWTRLNFSGEQTLAMSLHDAGDVGSTLSNAWLRFIPRLLWPEKPVIQPLGAEFYNISINRQGTSNLGLPIYGDLYWNYGWTGVIVGCTMIGWLFAMISRRSIAALRNMEFIMLPAILIAMLTAAKGINNFVLDSIISRLPIYFAYLFAAQLLVKYLKSARYSPKNPIS